MKKLIAVLMVVLMTVAVFAGCTGTAQTEPTNAPASADEQNPTASAESDLAYVKAKGTLIVGITEFEPMDYKDDTGEWIGFDADLAKLFAEKLGVTVEFTEIDWDSKVFELDGKTIDCVWNGMTLTDDVVSAMNCSVPYCNNSQVVVVNANVADKYQTADDCKELTFAVESKSAGQEQAEAYGFNFTEVKDQASALMEVASGTSDAAIIDALMAAAMVGEGTGYEQLTYTASLNSEEYGVGFRKTSDLTDEFNAFFEEMTANGEVERIAEEYKIQAALIK